MVIWCTPEHVRMRPHNDRERRSDVGGRWGPWPPLTPVVILVTPPKQWCISLLIFVSFPISLKSTVCLFNSCLCGHCTDTYSWGTGGTYPPQPHVFGILRLRRLKQPEIAQERNPLPWVAPQFARKFLLCFPSKRNTWIRPCCIHNIFSNFAFSYRTYTIFNRI